MRSVVEVLLLAGAGVLAAWVALSDGVVNGRAVIAFVLIAIAIGIHVHEELTRPSLDCPTCGHEWSEHWSGGCMQNDVYALCFCMEGRNHD